MPGRSKPNPNLVFNFGLLEGQCIEIMGKQVVLGRDKSADVQLDSPYVSRQHAEICFKGGHWSITDLESKNGVFINSYRIQPGKMTPLKNRDQVQIGSVSAFKFNDPEATVHESDLHLKSSGLWIDETNQDVYLYDQRLAPALSDQQFGLLAALLHNEGDVMTYDEIAKVLWPGASEGVERAAIDNLISRIRHRLAELDPNHDFIETVRGVGRRFRQKKIL